MSEGWEFHLASPSPIWASIRGSRLVRGQYQVLELGHGKTDGIHSSWTNLATVSKVFFASSLTRLDT
jgi:hypothetical protein